MANKQKQMVKLQKAELTLRKKRHSPPLRKTWDTIKNGGYKTWKDMKFRL